MFGHTKYMQESQRIGKHAFIGLRKMRSIAQNSESKLELIAAQGHQPWCQSKANMKLHIDHYIH